MKNKKYSHLFILQVGLKKTFSKFYYWITTLTIAANVIFLYYFILIQNTTWDAFLQSNSQFFTSMQIALSIANAVFVGMAISMLLNVVEEKKNSSKTSFLQTAGSLLFTVAVTGCSVCSAFLLPTLGIAASLTAFPLGGLEIKFLSLLLLGYAMYEYAKPLSGLCPLPKDKILSSKNGKLDINLSKKTLPQLIPMAVLVLFVLFVYALPRLPNTWKLQTQKSQVSTGQNKNKGQTSEIFAKINPPEGYEINATYGDLGPQMIEMGVIDLQKFADTYKSSGQPLTDEQFKILNNGSDKKIRITSEKPK